MEKIAEIRARQGKPDEAVAALKTALIDGRPEKAENFFEVARRLESWGLLTQARAFAEQGVASAGAELVASTENHSGGKAVHAHSDAAPPAEAAYATLQNAFFWCVLVFARHQGTDRQARYLRSQDSEWRQRQTEIRMENARQGMQGALVEMGTAAARYFTPEEKVALVQFAQKLRGSLIAPDVVERYAIPFAESAGLAEQEASWRYELLMSESSQPQQLLADMYTYIALQRRRLAITDLGPQLERSRPV